MKGFREGEVTGEGMSLHSNEEQERQRRGGGEEESSDALGELVAHTAIPSERPRTLG